MPCSLFLCLGRDGSRPGRWHTHNNPLLKQKFCTQPILHTVCPLDKRTRRNKMRPCRAPKILESNKCDCQFNIGARRTLIYNARLVAATTVKSRPSFSREGFMRVVFDIHVAYTHRTHSKFKCYRICICLHKWVVIGS